ncbi:MAG: bifunctional 4-hydroxy-2-oxoglutarate aldolase/2-dehydro-3-deoxy-phosphogluconate aldolase [Chloroflexi bacterium]|nr:bifunctional 4-hydroxy-2-oxoglutarate aldolase/2-dehydro-3-deoxy-phosphogluconate aldolase [Chloroflexota bacterium]
MEKNDILSALIDLGVVVILRSDDPGQLMRAVEALRAGGLRAFEVTMTVPGALDVMRDVGHRFGSEILLGAGTVLDGETARSAILAGGQFIVSPSLSQSVITAAHRYSKVVVPGAFTPTEILTAWEAGADIVKVFPIRSVGPHYLKDVLAPLPQVRLMPTGGVNLENAADFIRAGAVAVGMGGALLDKAILAEGRFEELTERARRLLDAIQRARATISVESD